jgi:hypothetical protein
MCAPSEVLAYMPPSIEKLNSAGVHAARTSSRLHLLQVYLETRGAIKPVARTAHFASDNPVDGLRKGNHLPGISSPYVQMTANL